MEKCHFFIWTMKDYCLILQGEIITKPTLLFQNVILLELLSKYFTENKNHFLVNTENIWCFSRMGEDEGSMMQCDNKNCKIIWFHQKCVQIKQIPKEIGIVLNVKNLIKVGKNTRYLSPFYANIPFLYSQKISENHSFSVFREFL